MKTKTENLLPKMLDGTVHSQYVKCGKPNCRCVRSYLHGPYYYHFVREFGRLRKFYLKNPDVEGVRMACAERQKDEKARRTANAEIWKRYREVRRSLRECHLMGKGVFSQCQG